MDGMWTLHLFCFNQVASLPELSFQYSVTQASRPFHGRQTDRGSVPYDLWSDMVNPRPTSIKVQAPSTVPYRATLFENLWRPLGDAELFIIQSLQYSTLRATPFAAAISECSPFFFFFFFPYLNHVNSADHIVRTRHLGKPLLVFGLAAAPL